MYLESTHSTLGICSIVRVLENDCMRKIHDIRTCTKLENGTITFAKRVLFALFLCCVKLSPSDFIVLVEFSIFN